MKTLPIDQMRRNFDRYMAQVAAGESFVITRYGKPICRLMAPDEEDLAQLKSELAESNSENLKI